MTRLAAFASPYPSSKHFVAYTESPSRLRMCHSLVSRLPVKSYGNTLVSAIKVRELHGTKKHQYLLLMPASGLAAFLHIRRNKAAFRCATRRRFDFSTLCALKVLSQSCSRPSPLHVASTWDPFLLSCLDGRITSPAAVPLISNTLLH